jgi:hypothetical protein
MTEEERETLRVQRYLDAVRAEAWSEHLYPRTAVGEFAEPPLDSGFVRTVAVYERELRDKMELGDAIVLGSSKTLRVMSEARDIAYEMLDQLSSPCPEREDVQRIIAKLDEVLGPDLVREADPGGLVLKPLSSDERRKILDRVQKMAEERGAQPSTIIIVEDEMGPILERVRQRRQEAGE